MGNHTWKSIGGGRFASVGLVTNGELNLIVGCEHKFAEMAEKLLLRTIILDFGCVSRQAFAAFIGIDALDLPDIAPAARSAP